MIRLIVNDKLSSIYDQQNSLDLFLTASLTPCMFFTTNCDQRMIIYRAPYDLEWREPLSRYTEWTKRMVSHRKFVLGIFRLMIVFFCFTQNWLFYYNKRHSQKFPEKSTPRGLQKWNCFRDYGNEKVYFLNCLCNLFKKKKVSL